MDDLIYTSALELAARIRDKQLSPVEVVQGSIDRIEALNPVLNCFCFTYFEEALELAREAERAVVEGEALGLLHGVPIAIKDVTPTKGKRTTRGSKMYEHWVPDHDAVMVQRLPGAGAIMVGKTTTPEFAYDSFTQSPLWGVTKNPWNPERTPGGSSGGSGAAVSSGCVALAEGSDMGGSIRIPASFCGLLGLKPSLGRIPMDILPTVFDNISHFGPLARTVSDAALFMNVAAGPYERDMMSLPDKLDFPTGLADDITGKNIALSIDLGYYAVDTEVESAVRSAAGALMECGANVVEVDLSWGRHINDAWFDLWGVYLDVCFTKDLERWRDRMDPNVVALIEHGRSLSAVELKCGEVIRTEQWHELCRIFDKYDALICPTTAHPAPRHGMSDSDFQDDTGDGRYHGLDMTCPFNFVSQCPVVSVPVGFSAEKLPIGMQIVGHRFDDLTVMQMAGVLEQALPWAHTRPPI